MFSISTTSTFINTFDPMMGSMILILGDVPIPLFLRLESSTKPCPITVLARNHIHEVPNHVAFTLSRTFAKKKILYRQRTCLRHPFVLVQVRFTSSSVFLFRFLCKFCVLRRSKDARAFARFSNWKWIFVPPCLFKLTSKGRYSIGWQLMMTTNLMLHLLLPRIDCSCSPSLRHPHLSTPLIR